MRRIGPLSLVCVSGCGGYGSQTLWMLSIACFMAFVAHHYGRRP